MTPSNEAVEAAAGAMCASDPNIRMGDAERIVQQRVNLEWREYIEPATAALTAALPLIRAQVLERIEHEMNMSALMNVEASSEWIDGFEFARKRTRAALKESHP